MRGMRLTAIIITLLLPSLAAEDWTVWGGPNGDFTLEADPGLADAWPEQGPPILWSRDLGSGYSAISYEDGVLYTQYRGVNMEDEHDIPYFYPVFYTMSAICIGCFIVLFICGIQFIRLRTGQLFQGRNFLFFGKIYPLKTCKLGRITIYAMDGNNCYAAGA